MLLMLLLVEADILIMLLLDLKRENDGTVFGETDDNFLNKSNLDSMCVFGWNP